jgi:hypothetical protein
MVGVSKSLTRAARPVKTGAPGHGTGSRVRGDQVVEHVIDKKRVLVIGGDSSGKSAFAKTLYADLRRKGLVPVLLSGKEVDGPDQEQFMKGVRRAFNDQYWANMAEAYKQLPVERKVLIVDDFHKSKFNRRGQNAVLKVANGCFGTVIMFVDDLYSIKELTDHSKDLDELARFVHWQIREFGFHLRGKLIEKWVTLGREFTGEENDLAHEVTEKEKLISTLLGKNLLPSHPVVVLTILQAAEANKNHNTITGSYGYLYEVLITTALARSSAKATDLDIKYTYLSRIAYYLFDNEQQGFSEQELKNINDDYFSQYSIRVSGALVRELEESGILYHAEGNYRFKYKYVYCYFVAKYIQDNLSNQSEATKLRTQLNDLADKIYFEEFANILIFFVYLTKDPELIDRLVGNAKRIYDEYEPCDLETHVDFINQMYKEAPKLTLPDSDTRENRESYRRRLDEVHDDDDVTPTQYESHDPEILTYDKGLSDLVKINIAFKTLQIVGQILRNFPGSLRSETKIEIALESYRLGLRTLRAILGLAESTLQDLRIYFSRLIKEQRAIETPLELAQKTDQFLIWLTVGAAFGIIKRISHSVGLKQLSETYRQVLDLEGAQTAISLIDLSIKLDHFAELPEDSIKHLHAKLGRNAFSYTVLRDLVADYFYLFPTDVRVKQRVGQMLGIEASSPKLLGNPEKKVRAV